MTDCSETQTEARRIVDQLAANGARLQFRESSGALLPSFTYELSAGGDRQRCRTIIACAKADAPVWAAVLREIAAQAGVA